MTCSALSPSSSRVRSASSSSCYYVSKRSSRRHTETSESWTSTYREGDLAALGNLLRQDAQEVEDAGVALDVAAQSRDNGGQDVLPVGHLYGQDGEADTQLDAHRPRAGSEFLQQQEDLVAQLGEVGRPHLSGEVKCDLASYVRRGAGLCAAGSRDDPGMRTD